MCLFLTISLVNDSVSLKHLSSHRFFGRVHVAHLVSFLCCYIMCLYLVPCCDVCYDFCIKTMFSSSLPPLYSEGLIYNLCMFAFSGIQHILCCVFVLLRHVYPVLPVFLDCPFMIGPSVFSNVYLNYGRFSLPPMQFNYIGISFHGAQTECTMKRSMT